MRTLGNIIWHIPFLGFIEALATFLLGGLLVITVVGSPIGFGLIQHASFLLSPFSKEMVKKKDLDIKQNKVWKAYGIVVRIIYFPFGLLLTLIALVQIIGLFISIIGIPVAIVLAKSLNTFLNPVNKVCIDRGVAEELQRRRHNAVADEMLKKKEL